MANDETRQVFADRFSQLVADAGRPKLDQLVREAQRSVRSDSSGRMVKLSRQKISAWKVGTNLPTQFEHVAPVLIVLISQARKRSPAPTLDGLYDMQTWKAFWERAAAIRASPPTNTGFNGSPDSTGDDREALDKGGQTCPYRGLAPFDVEHAAYFHGRDESIRTLMEAVNEISPSGGILMLVAPSGAGKSSLLRAGLVPALRAGGSHFLGDESAGWPVLIITPGQDPLGELTQHIHGLAEICAEQVDRRGDQLRSLITQYAEERAGTGARLILIVDQFEELFTLCDNDNDRQNFVDVLQEVSGASEQEPTPALVILSLRADFYSRCLAYPQLAKALQEHQIVLGPMTTKELREAITAPAEAVGLRIDPRLSELVLQDASVSLSSIRSRGGRAAYEDGLLPLLSHALRATWQHRQSGRLTIGGYRASGGIHGAIILTADRTLTSLDVEGRSAAMNLLLKMTRIGEDTQDTRRHWEKERLLSYCPNRDAAERTLEVLVRERLVSADADKVQITHDALLQAWPQLRGWIDKNRADLLLWQRVEEDTAAWEGQHRDTSLLYRGARLKTAQQWAKKADIDRPSGAARAFIDVSARHHLRSTWAIRGGVALVVMMALVASAAARIASRQRDDAVFGECTVD